MVPAATTAPTDVQNHHAPRIEPSDRSSLGADVEATVDGGRSAGNSRLKRMTRFRFDDHRTPEGSAVRMLGDEGVLAGQAGPLKGAFIREVDRCAIDLDTRHAFERVGGDFDTAFRGGQDRASRDRRLGCSGRLGSGGGWRRKRR